MNFFYLKKIHNSEDRNRELLKILKQRGGLAFENFTKALMDTNQHELFQMLHQRDTKANGSFNLINQPSNWFLKLFGHKTDNAAQTKLKRIYKNSFKRVNPFSLPFTFDIEQTWVSISLNLNKNWSTKLMENHCQMIEEVFKDGKQLLIIEGAAASGKTSLMRRIAYDWAVGKLKSYDYVFYAEFRKIKKQEFPTIVALIQDSFQNLQEESIEQLTHAINDNKFCQRNRILVLLDGFDEAQVETPCTEIEQFFTRGNIRKIILFRIIISTRPGPSVEENGTQRYSQFCKITRICKQ